MRVSIVDNNYHNSPSGKHFYMNIYTDDFNDYGKMDKTGYRQRCATLQAARNIAGQAKCAAKYLFTICVEE